MKRALVNLRPSRLLILLTILLAAAAYVWGQRVVAVFIPSEEMFIRVFKKEGVLEVWTRTAPEPFTLRKSYLITANSGGPGPKRQEGDFQVPEGFYQVNRFNPHSLYHLSLGLDYPNASDKILTIDPARPGSDIFIHGGAASVGCMPVGDPAIEEIYALAESAHRHGHTIQVHIFPARMEGPSWQEFSAAAVKKKPELAPFWATLQPGYDAFAKTHQLPDINVTSKGEYTVAQQ